jgi:hypothetical protein
MVSMGVKDHGRSPDPLFIELSGAEGQQLYDISVVN